MEVSLEKRKPELQLFHSETATWTRFFCALPGNHKRGVGGQSALKFSPCLRMTDTINLRRIIRGHSSMRNMPHRKNDSFVCLMSPGHQMTFYVASENCEN